MSLLNELGGSRTQVSRPVHPEPGAPQGRPAHGHHKTQAVKKRLAEVAPCAGLQIGLLNPTADFAAMGRDYSPILAGASERDFSRKFHENESEVSYEKTEFKGLCCVPCQRLDLCTADVSSTLAWSREKKP